MTRYLTDPQAIREWVEAHGGHPIMMETPQPGGGSLDLIQISFGQHALNADHNEGPDRPVAGFELVDWADWLAVFEDQKLALAVGEDRSDGQRADYRLMAREEIDDPQRRE